MNRRPSIPECASTAQWASVITQRRALLTTLTLLPFMLLAGCGHRDTRPLLADPPVSADARLSLKISAASTAAGSDSTEPDIKPEAHESLHEAKIVFSLDQASEARYEDVWQRMRTGFSLQSDSEQPTIQYWTQFFASRKRHLNDSAENARPYIHHILESVEARGMPAELALLPLVESSFDPFAGGGQRASGLWQFMPVTAQRFGMGYRHGYQARRDVLLSTNAALDYLSWLHSRYEDWPLALAAYNAGEGRVDRALKKNRAAGLKDDYWSLDLPQETQNYVPKLLALGRLVDEPAQFEIDWPTIPNQPAFSTVKLPPDTRLSIAADLINVPEEHLGRLNPALEHGATPSGRAFEILVPADKAQALREQIPQITSLARLNPPQRPEPPTSNTRADTRPTTAAGDKSLATYTVRRGDTLYDLARSNGVTVMQLQGWNRLAINKPLQIGQRLQVKPPPRIIVYRVRSGDSLWAIARQHGVRVSQLKTWNKMKGDRPIKPGQQLRIHIESI